MPRRLRQRRRRRRSGGAFVVERILPLFARTLRSARLRVLGFRLEPLVARGPFVGHAAAPIRIPAGAPLADPILELVAVHAARPDAGVRRNRRSALRAEGGRRGRSVAGRASDLARLWGRHICGIVPAPARACTRPRFARLCARCNGSTWWARAAPARRGWPGSWHDASSCRTSSWTRSSGGRTGPRSPPTASGSEWQMPHVVSAG